MLFDQPISVGKKRGNERRNGDMRLTGGWVVELRAVWATKRYQSNINLISQSGVRGGSRAPSTNVPLYYKTYPTLHLSSLSLKRGFSSEGVKATR